MTYEEIKKRLEYFNTEADHTLKEIKLLNYEVEKFGVKEDTEQRAIDLAIKHLTQQEEFNSFILSISGLSL